MYAELKLEYPYKHTKTGWKGEGFVFAAVEQILH